MEIVIATQNCHKVREFRRFFSSLKACDFYSLIDFPSFSPLPEEGSSFEENAAIKAIHAARCLNKWALADDSGLVVPALGGAPGIYSARYAGDDATDKDNRIKLLKDMRHLKGEGRHAYFVCYLALARPDGKLSKIVSGFCEGHLLDEERGKGGFGYDPLFVKHDYHQSFGELSEDTKNRISHRAKAASKLQLYLEGESCR
jgi:XTP/dITP diphosphohydrolase